MEDNGLKGIVALAVLLLITYLLSFIQPKYNQLRTPEPCSFHPSLTTQDLCESAGCCWNQFHTGHNKGKWGCSKTCPLVGSGYVVNSVKLHSQASGKLLHLQRASVGDTVGSGFPFLLANFTYETMTRLHVKIVPATEDQKVIPRWEVPESLIPRPKSKGVPENSTDYEVEESPDGQPFHLRILRKSTRQPLFDMGPYRMNYLDQYLEISTVLMKNASLYGLGETTMSGGLELPRFQAGSVITLWTLDHAAADPDVNLYGSHPFYIQVAPDGFSHGVLLLNSNGMDIYLTDTLLTYKVLGGVFDFYFFTGPTPEAVIQQYQQVIGKPAVPPAWSLGFHQCRWGYKSVDRLEQVLDSYVEAEIPLDVMWSDIDHMDRYQDWTLDPVSFAPEEMGNFIKNKLHKTHRHWVPIVDAGVAISNDYKAYKDGLKRGVYINDSSNKPLVAEVWPGPVHFPDFFNPETVKWWGEQFQAFKEVANYSGIWLDMNEASNFCWGEVCHLPEGWTVSGEKRDNFDNCKIECRQPNSNDTLFYPKYQLNNENRHAPLLYKTLPMNAVHKGGHIEYNTHNLFGLTETRATHQALANITGQRPFILARSTFPSSGKWTAHWTGDNAASWDNLKWSIQGVLKSNLYGIPMVGADICGFMGDTTEELCARWISVGAFYTFVRNHNTLFTHQDQELYIWESVTSAARRALGLRYQLISYLLGQFVLANRHGGTVAKPLWFAYPADEIARNTDTQWLLGEALLITPVVDSGLTTVTGWFPAGSWYSAWDHTRLTGPANHSLVTPLDHVHVHLRSGTITPMHDTKMTVYDSLRTNVTLVVALDAANYTHANYQPAYAQFPFCQQLREKAGLAALLNEKKKKNILAGPVSTGLSAAPAAFSANHVAFACGMLYLEDEASLDISKGKNLEVWYGAAAHPTGDAGNLTAQVQYNRLAAKKGLKNLFIKQVIVLGIGKLKPGHHYAAYIQGDSTAGETGLSDVHFHPKTNKLDITNLQIPVTDNFTLRWEVKSGDANAAVSLTGGAHMMIVTLLAGTWGAILLLAAVWW